MVNWFSLGSDLAPGDQKSLGLDFSALRVTSVQQASQPEFAQGYERLWAEFGAKNELESRSILEERLSWNSEGKTKNGFLLRYEMIWVESEGKFVAVRDHTAIISETEAVVHLSHVLVAPEWRRSGIAGWMRAWPVRWAREAMGGALKPMTLIAEMEPMDQSHADRFTRLASAEKAGFLKISGIDYHQPDFRTHQAIDAEGVARPIPMNLLVRSLGSDPATPLTTRRVTEWVSAIYTMYGEGIRESEMRSVWDQWQKSLPSGALIELVLPTSV